MIMHVQIKCHNFFFFLISHKQALQPFICNPHMEFYNAVPLLTLHADNIRNAVFAASDGSFLER